MNPKQELIARGFKDPIQIKDLKDGEAFYLTPKGDLLKAISVKKQKEPSSFFDITTERLLDEFDSKEHVLALSGGVWVDREINPEEMLIGKNPKKSRCVKALLAFFKTKDWKIMDSNNDRLTEDQIHEEFYSTDGESEFKTALKKEENNG